MQKLPPVCPTLTFGPDQEEECFSDGSDAPAEPKDPRNPHAKDSNIPPGSTVRGCFDIKRKKGKKPIRAKRSGTVIEGVGRNKWLVQYGSKDSNCAVKHSNSLALVPGQQCPGLVLHREAGYGSDSDSDSDDDAIYNNNRPDNSGYILSYSSNKSSDYDTDDESDDDDCGVGSKAGSKAGSKTSSGVSSPPVSKTSSWSKKRKATKRIMLASEKKRSKEEVDSEIDDDDDVVTKEQKEDRKIGQKIDRYQRRIDENVGLQITCIACKNKDPTKKPDPNEIMTRRLQCSHVPDGGNPAKQKA